MTETKIEAPMYLLPGRLTPQQEHHAQATVMDLYGSDITFTEFHAYMAAIATPIQPCADVETACWITPGRIAFLRDQRINPSAAYASAGATPTSTAPDDVALVRRTDMEAQINALNMKITQLKSCLANIRATCLQAAEGPTPANSMVAAGIRTMHLADVALNGEGRV
ncbi:hypothetical protein [Komagataeibacter xylinus]|uniref:hypothetical protein n=1 Tax=Komagataeibacter xylinus TaxID=28448 RepID=UPI001031BF29|nr:hypothetical protein [Komagataeibacter xylinus]